MRLAFFSPLHPKKSGISDYSEELLPNLARYAELDLFFDGAPPTNQTLVRQFPVYPIGDFPRLHRTRRYDTCLYQMGNNTYHTAIHATLRKYPGITVLHEHTLHDFFMATAADRGDWAFYWRELAYNADPAFMATLLPETPAYSPSLPLARRVVDLSLGIIVHNHEMARRVLADNSQARVSTVPMGMSLPPAPLDGEEQANTRRKLNLPADAYVVTTFGHLNASKRIDVVLRAFARLRRHVPNALYLIVGKIEGVGRNTGEYDLPALVEEHGVDPQSVVVTGFVPREALLGYLQATDVCVNLRYPVYGETSAAALRIMAYGKPIIVSDVATFADLPEGTCVRVEVNAAEMEFLFRCLLFLAERPDIRAQLGHNARRYVQEQHTLDHAAAETIKAIRSILAAVEKDNQSGLPLGYLTRKRAVVG